MFDFLLNAAGAVKERIELARLHRRWRHLRNRGMHIGNSVLLPADLWIDVCHCHLISIGDNCGFGPQCLILAHDAQMDEYLDAARIARVAIHESCHIGARCIILPGVEIGPRTVVGAGSVISRSLPPDTVCAGSPAKVICSLDEYLAKHRSRMTTQPQFEYAKYDIHVLTPERQREMLRAVAEGDAYITGGHTAELQGRGGSERTGSAPARKTRD